MVYGYDPSDTEDPWAIHDVTVPDWANDLQIFEVGKGYWILVTEDVTLEIPNQGNAPTVAFTTPIDLSEVTEPTDLLGDVSSPMLDFWRVSSRLIGQTDWQELNRGSQPRAGEKLAGFDPTLLLNGLHELRLEATDSLGRSADVDNNRCFGVPGIIVTHDQNLLVAPQRRTTGWNRAFGSNHAYPTYIDHCGRGFSDPWATRKDKDGYYYE